MAILKTNKTYTATKVYWIAFGALVLFLSIVSVLAAAVLNQVDTSTETLSATLASFQSIKSKLFYGNIIGFAFLLIVSAYQHKAHGKWLFYLPTAMLFGAYSLVYFNVLNEWLFQVLQAHGLDGGGFSANYFFGFVMVLIGIMMCAVVATGVVVNKRRKG